MKKSILVLIAAVALASCTQTNPYADVAGLGPTESLLLYPDGQDSDTGLPGALGPGESNGLSGENQELRWGIVTNIADKARIDLYIPENCNGKMIVICPPGGYSLLSDLTEGQYAARWLAHYGIASCVLYYRLPNGHPEVPLTDVQNAFRYCRSRAEEWGVKEIGVMGMSAGGHLAAIASTLYTDDLTRPDFQVLLYPLVTMGEHCPQFCRDVYMGTGDYSEDYLARFCPEKNVTKDTPKAFMAHSHHDTVIECDNTLDYYEALVHEGVDAELDIYPYGCHGWGFADPRLMSKKELKESEGSDLMTNQLKETRDELYSALSRWLEVRVDEAWDTVTGIAEPDTTLFLYPEGQDSPAGLSFAEGALENNGLSGSSYTKNWGFLHPGNGDNATIDLYFPEEPNGQLVILCPGGGYSELNALVCGRLGGDFFKRNGITACVLKYRMPNGHKMIPLQDVWNTMRYCRAMSKQWGIDQIGVLGGSAGGHLAACAATMYRDPVTRPDFSILLYPVTTFSDEYTDIGSRVRLIGEDLPEEDIEAFSTELHVTPDTPPTFIACNRHDWIVKCENFTRYQKALYYNNVDAEFHAYNIGTHGWAFGAQNLYNFINNDESNSCGLIEDKGFVMNDDLGPCRKDFETSLLRWLKSLRPKPASIEFDGKTADVGQWYSVSPKKAVDANGDQWTGYFKKGSENKVMILLYGGGVSVDEYTAARGSSIPDGGFNFYVDHYDDINPATALQGIASTEEINPFRNWTIVALPYTTGDFHCGTGEYEYVGLDGEKHILYHHGYTNAHLLMKEIRPLLGTPEAVLITGGSAGGFGTGIMADYFAGLFPETENITAFVDGGIAAHNWPEIARNVWKAPKKIADRCVSDDIVLDCLLALHKDRPNVKILVECSTRDMVLSIFQEYFDTGKVVESNSKAGDRFCEILRHQVEVLQREVPGCGIFIWNDVILDKENNMTAHTAAFYEEVFNERPGNGTIAQWLENAINGKVESFGLELLN